MAFAPCAGMRHPRRGRHHHPVWSILSFLLVCALWPRASSAAPAPAAVTYDPNRGTVIRTLDGRWEFNPYAMVQLTHTIAGAGEVTDTGFRLKVARLIFHGNALTPSLVYHVQINVADGRGVAEDVYLRWQATPWLALLGGQIEVTLNRQHITLEAYQELVERSLTDARFNLQRDIGAIAYLSDASKKHELTVGFFNGAGQNTINENRTYLASMRLAYNPWGPIEYREADLDDNAKPKLSLAVAGAYNPERRVAGDDPDKPTITREIAQAVGEVTLRYRGLSITGETHLRRRYNEAGSLLVDAGGFAQAGFFLIPQHLQIAARASRVGVDLTKTDARDEEIAGVNYYVYGHRLKLQADFGHVGSQQAPKGWRGRMQLEFFL